MDYRWYVAQALPGLESTAVHHLSREGVSAFSPMTSGERRVRLFPGYIFVELESPEEAGVVNRTRGVRKLLPVHADHPLPIRERDFVDVFRDRMARGDFDEKAAEEIVYRFVPQDLVMISIGPFRDLHGRFLRYRKGCGVIALALLGRENEVSVPRKGLVPFDCPTERGARSVRQSQAA